MHIAIVVEREILNLYAEVDFTPQRRGLKNRVESEGTLYARLELMATL